MTSPSVIDQALLDTVLSEARTSPRLRKNFNFHDSAAHPCQRLINAVLPDAYIRPHRHLDLHAELAQFAPEEGAPESGAYLAWLKSLFRDA